MASRLQEVTSDKPLGSGQESDVFAIDDRRVLRLYRGPCDERYLARLATFYARLDRRDAPFVVPEIIEFCERDGVAYAVEVRVSGIDLTKALGRMEGEERFRAIRNYVDAVAGGPVPETSTSAVRRGHRRQPRPPRHLGRFRRRPRRRPSHILGVLFQKLTNTRFQVLHYRGDAPAVQDLVAGQIDLAIDSPTTALPQVRAGSINAYAVTAKSRLAEAPDIPTVDEAGLPGLYLSAWFALFAPKGTPHDVIARLNSAAREALADPATQFAAAPLAEEVFPPHQQTPEALSALQKADIEKWWPIIKKFGIKAE